MVHGVVWVRGVGELAGLETEFVISRFDYGVSAFENLINKDVLVQMQNRSNCQEDLIAGVIPTFSLR